MEGLYGETLWRGCMEGLYEWALCMGFMYGLYGEDYRETLCLNQAPRKLGKFIMTR